MEKLMIVSVADGTAANINASLLFYHNLFEVSSFLKRVYFLTLEGHVPDKYLEYLRHLGVDVVEYSISEEIMTDDPYRVKYLLKFFVDEVVSEKSTMLYLDPDHIIQRELTFDDGVSEGGTIMVSSEIKMVEESILKKIGITYHCNTSLLYSNVGLLRTVCEGWLEEYDGIRESIGVRYREEIAMMIAAKKRSMVMQPCNEIFQCTIDTYSKTSALCHYGGHFRETAVIKGILNGYDYGKMILDFDRYRSEEPGDCARVICDIAQRYLKVIRENLG